MQSNGYHTAITVSTDPEAAFQAVTAGFRDWWTDHDDAFKKPGDIVTFRFLPNITYWTFKAEEIVLNSRVVLVCTQAFHVHEGMPASIEKEWQGTRMVFDITRTTDGTRIDFTHEGLIPGLECYDICEQGWNHFVNGKLKDHLDANGDATVGASDTE